VRPAASHRHRERAARSTRLPLPGIVVEQLAAFTGAVLRERTHRLPVATRGRRRQAFRWRAADRRRRTSPSDSPRRWATATAPRLPSSSARRRGGFPGPTAGGCRFDIGPHRFFTQNDEVRRLFRDTVGSEAIRVDRMTRILYDGRYFDYPLTIGNAIGGTGLGEAVALGASYLRARVGALSAGDVEPRDFEAWVVRQFGRRLYESFFRVYTEKVWGVPCTRISASGRAADQGLSFAAAVPTPSSARRGGPRSFECSTIRASVPARSTRRWPRRPSNAARRCAPGRGRSVLVDGTVRAIEVADAASTTLVEADFLCNAAHRPGGDGRPPPPPQVLGAALRHRDHIAVNLVSTGCRSAPVDLCTTAACTQRASPTIAFSAVAGGRTSPAHRRVLRVPRRRLRSPDRQRADRPGGTGTRSPRPRRAGQLSERLRRAQPRRLPMELGHEAHRGDSRLARRVREPAADRHAGMFNYNNETTR
jgi:hypothetical protein